MLGLVSVDFDFIPSPFLLVHETSISGHRVNSAAPGFRLLRRRSRSECTRRPQDPPPPDPARPAVGCFRVRLSPGQCGPRETPRLSESECCAGPKYVRFSASMDDLLRVSTGDATQAPMEMSRNGAT